VLPTLVRRFCEDPCAPWTEKGSTGWAYQISSGKRLCCQLQRRAVLPRVEGLGPLPARRTLGRTGVSSQVLFLSAAASAALFVSSGLGAPCLVSLPR